CAAGRVAFMTVGHDAVRDLRAAVGAGRLRVGFAPIPHRAGVPPATVRYAWGYAVPARALRRKAAVELAADLTDSLADAARGDAGIELPAVAAAAQGVAAADTLGWEAAFLRAAAHGRPGWGARVAQWREVEAELADLMVRVTVGGADPARAARATAGRSGSAGPGRSRSGRGARDGSRSITPLRRWCARPPLPWPRRRCSDYVGRSLSAGPATRRSRPCSIATGGTLWVRSPPGPPGERGRSHPGRLARCCSCWSRGRKASGRSAGRAKPGARASGHTASWPRCSAWRYSLTCGARQATRRIAGCTTRGS